MQKSREEHSTKREKAWSQGNKCRQWGDWAGGKVSEQREAGSHRPGRTWNWLEMRREGPRFPNSGPHTLWRTDSREERVRARRPVGKLFPESQGRPWLLDQGRQEWSSCNAVGFGIYSGGRADQICWRIRHYPQWCQLCPDTTVLTEFQCRNKTWV